MNIRKYLFWMNQEGIRTYKVAKKGSFELMKPLGKSVYSDKDMEKFFEWFDKSAAITEDEYVDFCFLSDSEIELPELKYATSSESSWDKQEINIFCEKYINETTYEVFYEKDKCFVCQNGNVYDKSKIKKLYIKCNPEFIVEAEEKKDVESEENISRLNRYFIDTLTEL